MKQILCLFLLLASSAGAQSIRFPADLRAYLELTELQVTNILNHQTAFFAVVESEEDRLLTLDLEVRRELAKAQPDPVLVGAKIVEGEMIDRGLETKYIETVGKIRKELTDAQNTKMKSLEDAYRLVGLIEQAQDAGLWDPKLEEGPFFLFSEKPELRTMVARAKKNVRTLREKQQR